MEVGSILVIVCPIVGFLVAVFHAWGLNQIKVCPDDMKERGQLLVQEEQGYSKASLERIYEIYQAIYNGAHSFLYQEYTYMAVFVAVFSVIIVVVIGVTNSWSNGVFTALAFLTGACTSILSGLIGMKIAVFSNARTALKASGSLADGFRVAIKGGIVMGFTLVSMGLINLFILITLFKLHYASWISDTEVANALFEAVAGFGLGGSSIGMFGRVGGGIYTKAADVGADLVGKVEAGIPEDDPRNPAVIADNVGDNVGDIAGMGADLFGSFAESTCAALVMSSQSKDFIRDGGWNAVAFPLCLSALGIVVCFLTSLSATHFLQVKATKDIEPMLKLQLVISTVLMTPAVFVLTQTLLPHSFSVGGVQNVRNWHIGIAVSSGLWSGLIVGYITEYYTSHSYAPVRELARSCETGAATNIIYGLALGYKSVIVPILCLAATIFVSHVLAGMYGVALAALGVLSTLAISLTIDSYGPICDNAGGIAEMAEMGEHVRDRTDALDAAGNTTAAIGKGFAIASAALVSLALFGGYVTIKRIETVNLLNPLTFCGLLVGAMLPYWFTALTMKSVGKAALAMVEEVREQFARDPGILEGTSKPDYDRCIQISTDASLREMIAPGALVMLTPLVVGFVFGKHALAGLLCGALVSGVQLAISQSNSGGAWDNAKKYVSSLGKKGTEEHMAAIVGDTVGDPLKDTSGPALNILVKLMAIISLVFAQSFPDYEYGYLGALFGYK